MREGNGLACMMLARKRGIYREGAKERDRTHHEEIDQIKGFIWRATKSVVAPRQDQLLAENHVLQTPGDLHKGRQQNSTVPIARVACLNIGKTKL
jgi:hypothetical protein